MIFFFESKGRKLLKILSKQLILASNIRVFEFVHSLLPSLSQDLHYMHNCMHALPLQLNKIRR